MVKEYIPKQGDIVFLDFNSTKGHEQKGTRPGMVISNDVFNINTKMVIILCLSNIYCEIGKHSANMCNVYI